MDIRSIFIWSTSTGTFPTACILKSKLKCFFFHGYSLLSFGTIPIIPRPVLILVQLIMENKSCLLVNKLVNLLTLNVHGINRAFIELTVNKKVISQHQVFIFCATFYILVRVVCTIFIL